MISISLWSSFHFRPPSGCLQYLFGNRVGTFETFNFASGSGHLVNQNYAVCIRQEFGLLSSRNANMTKSNNIIFVFQAIAAYSTEFVMHQEPFLWIPMDLRRQAHRKLKQDVLEISSKLKVISRFQQQFNNWNLNQFFATLSSWLCAYFFSTWLALCFNRKNRSFWIVNQFLTSFSFLLGTLIKRPTEVYSILMKVTNSCDVFSQSKIAHCANVRKKENLAAAERWNERGGIQRSFLQHSCIIKDQSYNMLLEYILVFH